ncbi:MAG: hypothetical protein JWP38_1056 [Herbaspirillum sp.]|jgi:hypothetical protein|nr:hypothetical protein [Herbaspirillum sp.]
MPGAINPNPPPKQPSVFTRQGVHEMTRQLEAVRVRRTEATTAAAFRPLSPSRGTTAMTTQIKSASRSCATDARRPIPERPIPRQAPLQSAAAKQRTAAPGRDPERQRKDFKIFSTLYNTNAGAEAINAAMRGDKLKLSIREVISEIGRRNGEEEILSYKRAKVDLEFDMEQLATKSNLLRVADEIYAQADPAKLSAHRIYRGQGMTSAGIDKLMDLWDSGTPVKATHFLSCDKNSETALLFANNLIKGVEEPVLFQILGFSNTRLSPYMSVLGETESLFSPHATFKIEQIGKGKNTGCYVVKLTEISRTETAQAMPY